MKFILIALFLFFSGVRLTHGQRYIDTLNKAFSRTGEDTNRVLLLIELSANYQFSNSDTALTLTEVSYTARTKNQLLERGIKGNKQARGSEALAGRTPAGTSR